MFKVISSMLQTWDSLKPKVSSLRNLLFCPISQSIPEPENFVIASDGQGYDKNELYELWRESDISPVTKETLRPYALHDPSIHPDGRQTSKSYKYSHFASTLFHFPKPTKLNATKIQGTVSLKSLQNHDFGMILCMALNWINDPHSGESTVLWQAHVDQIGTLLTPPPIQDFHDTGHCLAQLLGIRVTNPEHAVTVPVTFKGETKTMEEWILHQIPSHECTPPTIED